MPNGFVCHPLPTCKHDRKIATPQSVASSFKDAPMATGPSLSLALLRHLPPRSDAVNHPCAGLALHGNEEDEDEEEEEEIIIIITTNHA